MEQRRLGGVDMETAEPIWKNMLRYTRGSCASGQSVAYNRQVSPPPWHTRWHCKSFFCVASTQDVQFQVWATASLVFARLGPFHESVAGAHLYPHTFGAADIMLINVLVDITRFAGTFIGPFFRWLRSVLQHPIRIRLTCCCCCCCCCLFWSFERRKCTKEGNLFANRTLIEAVRRVLQSVSHSRQRRTLPPTLIFFFF